MYSPTAFVTYLAALTGFVCFVILLVRMFERGRGGFALLCIGLVLCCTVGQFVAFVFGWTKAREWNLTNLMTVWTVAYAILFLSGILNPAPIQFLRSFAP